MLNLLSSGTTRRSVLAGGSLIFGGATTIGGTFHDLEEITQVLANAIAPGRADIWARWTHASFVLTDENGEKFGRERFLGGMRPLPAGSSGTIEVVDFTATQVAQTVVATYVLNEQEHYHGDLLHARYRCTDTWVRGAHNWKLLASQIIALRTDPPSVELPRKLWDEYDGRYHLPDGSWIGLESDGRAGRLRKPGVPTRPLRAELPDLLFSPGQPRLRYLVRRGPDGMVIRIIERRESWDLVWERQPCSTCTSD